MENKFLPAISDPKIMYKIARGSLIKFNGFNHFQDLVQEFVMGMIEALEKGDPNKAIRSYQYSYGIWRSTQFYNKIIAEFHNKCILKDNPGFHGIGECQCLPYFIEQNEILRDDIHKTLSKTIKSLNKHEKAVIKGRFFESKTLEELGNKYGYTRERIRQIQNEAISKLEFKLKKVIQDINIDSLYYDKKLGERY